MSSSRKKQDEKHLKALRALASASANKHCLDCGQRGPTYVNVTIGSFVCTKCSGILRGLTPPHRVKSISMATFTQEEVDDLVHKGNQYCKKVWLALCEHEPPTKDEQEIKDFMIDKYEKKRYYVEPSIAMKMSSFNGVGSSSQVTSPSAATPPSVVPPPVRSKAVDSFVSNTRPADNNNSKVYMNGRSSGSTPSDPFPPPQSASFANFDNASIFNATSTVPGTGSLMSGGGVCVPTEDRYAALKDLDSLMKSQKAAALSPPTPPAPASDPWGGAVSNGSVWSPPPQAPCQPPEPSAPLNGFTSNPFANDNNWASENGFGNTEASKNPFKSSKLFDWPGSNGTSEVSSSQSLNSFQWLSSSNHANPFAVGGFSGSPPTNSAYHSNNPFL